MQVRGSESHGMAEERGLDMDDGSSSGSRSRPRRSIGGNSNSCPISSLGVDLLCNIFALLDPWDIAFCSAVCKSWHNVIHNSTLLRDRYHNMHTIGFGFSIEHSPSITPMNIYLEKLAIKEHVSALTDGSAEVYQWMGHNVGVSQCRAKRGLIATGVGDKVVRLWSAESYKLLSDYAVPETRPLVDFDFDESKIVGLIGSELCIWRRSGKRTLFKSSGGPSSRSLCMRYIDPEAVIGCEDGRARIFDMYSGSCARIIRMHGGPVTCLALDEQLILGGSSSGRVTLADHSSGQWVASLKSSFSPLGITSLCFSPRSHLVFAGSTAGYSHCWDLRTLRPLWETRTSSNVTYAIHHLSHDTSTLAAGGIDGVLRILDQGSGEVASSFVLDKRFADERLGDTEKGKARPLLQDISIQSLPRSIRPSITCLAVGRKKVITTHNEKYIRVWKFDK